MGERALAWRVERACFNAWPALEDLPIGDWMARSGRGLYRRTNSANPLKARPRRIDASIATLEAIYGGWRMPAIFRVPSIVDPSLDGRLDRLGYRLEGETLTLFGALADLKDCVDQRVEILETPGADWLAAKASLSDLSPQQADTYRDVIASLALPAAFAALWIDGRIASLAYAARHRGLLVIEGVVTAGPQRGKGLARRMLSTLLASKVAAGCKAACLQVQADNIAALKLYGGLGLTTELYRYHYRREGHSASRD